MINKVDMNLFKNNDNHGFKIMYYCINFCISQIHTQSQWSLHQSLQDPCRENRPHRKGRGGHKNGGKKYPTRALSWE